MSISAAQIKQHRQQFPALANKTYFNYGGQGPMPQAAMEATINAQEYMQLRGPFSTEVNAWIAQEVEKIVPDAINKIQDYIPSIYDMARSIVYDASAHTLTVTTNKAHDFQEKDDEWKRLDKDYYPAFETNRAVIFEPGSFGKFLIEDGTENFYLLNDKYKDGVKKIDIS